MHYRAYDRDLSRGDGMDPAGFATLISGLTADLAGRPLDAALARHLNATRPPGGRDYSALFEVCRAGVAAGWLCNRTAGGVRYGRAIKPGPASDGFSVDVVEMADLEGPFHAHPHGEIDLVMPLDPTARFDGHGAGWVVYGPGTAHHPTVSGGRALVLYLLPQGAIDFQASPP